LKHNESPDVEQIEQTGATGSADLGLQIAHADVGAETGFPDDVLVTRRRPGLVLAKVALLTALTGAGAGWGFVAPLTRRREDGTVVLSEAGTAEAPCDAQLVQQVRELFDQGASEFFRDGIHSRFSRARLYLLSMHRRQAVRAIIEYVNGERARPDVLSEALRWIADFPDSSSLNERWALLTQSLRHPSSRVRDGAILGFAALDDPHASDLMLEAKNIERVTELRRLIDSVIAQLDRPRR
jgi:hypothetical protein